MTGGRRAGRDEERGAAGAKQPADSAWPAFLAAHAVLLARVEERLAAAGMPPLGWYDVLWALERAPEGRLRMHELAEAATVSRSNLTRLCDRLEGAGLVRRDRHCTDRRGAYAVLTSEGRGLRRKMWPIYARAISELFDRHLEPAENAAMRAALLRLLAAQRGGGEARSQRRRGRYTRGA